MQKMLDKLSQTIITPVEELITDWTEAAGVRLLIQREDQLDSEISGNKWRKLKYNLLAAREAGKKHLLTFGGAYSNHLAATAAAGRRFGFQTLGVVRGEATEPLNPTLAQAVRDGMALRFISRSLFRDPEARLAHLSLDLADYYLLPEGGTNALALHGTREIITDSDWKEPVDYWCVCCGTGGTLAGMITGLRTGEQALGFAALKGNFLDQEVAQLLPDGASSDWSIQHDFHFGGYARFNEELIQFINAFKQAHGIPLDPIYTGKMMYGIFTLIQQGYFARGTTIMAVHTGGLQGIAGFNQRFGPLLV